VESEPGRGSRFWFDVPLAPGVPSNVADAALPGPASSSA